MQKSIPPINVEDIPPEKFSWGEIRWIWSGKVNLNAEQTLGQVIIYSGKKNTFHSHPNCEEVMYILEGECDHWVGEDVYHLKPGMTIVLPREIEHYAVVTSKEPLKALIFYSTPSRETNVIE